MWEGQRINKIFLKCVNNQVLGFLWSECIFFVYKGSAKNINKDKVWITLILQNYRMNVSDIIGYLLIFSCLYGGRIELK